VNVDYSHLIELKDFMRQQNQTYTFQVKDSGNWRKTFIGEVYISFGKPVLVKSDDDRKELAYKTREICLDLVKIQPINILSSAIVQLQPQHNEDITQQRIYESIDDVLCKLEKHHDKYRGFSARRSPEEIMTLSNIDIDVELLAGYNIYSNNIAHYLK
jgi:hypothetical protein